MTELITSPSEIKADGNKPKIIQEFFGRINTNTEDISIAKMNSPEGWAEPGQTPEFDEYTVVLRGVLCAETEKTKYEIKAGESFIASKGEWVRYSTPHSGGSEYIAVCIPAFGAHLVHRNGGVYI